MPFFEFPRSFARLMRLASTMPAASPKYSQLLGMIALMLSVICHQRDEQLFHDLLNEMGDWVPTDAAKRIFKTAGLILNEGDRAWFQGQIDAILRGAEDG